MLEVVENAATETCQVLDDRGRLMATYPRRQEADAFVEGYKTARQDAAMIAAHATDGLGQRIGGARG